MMWNPVRSAVASAMPSAPQVGAPRGGAGFNPYAAGNKVYGGGRPAPTYGAVDKTGYAIRDGKAAARREALMRRTGGLSV